MKDLLLNLKKELEKPLPGEKAQRLLSPSSRTHIEPKQVKETAKMSAVLLLLYPKGGVLHTVFIVRPDYGGVHAGQISFPGGQVEPEDLNLEATALRETEEEVGLARNRIEVLGALTPLFIPVSNFLVYPFLGFTPNLPEWYPDPLEVDHVLEVPIASFSDDRSIRKGKIELREGFFYESPHYYIQKKIIWGATAMILSEFSAILRRIDQ